jgi:hypothetical protein
MGQMRYLDPNAAKSIHRDGTIIMPVPGEEYDPEFPGVNQNGMLTIGDMDFLMSVGYRTVTAVPREPSGQGVIDCLNPRPGPCPEMEYFKFRVRDSHLPTLVYQASGAFIPEHIKDMDRLLGEMFHVCHKYEKPVDLVIDLKKLKFADMVLIKKVFDFFMERRGSENIPRVVSYFNKICILQPNKQMGSSVRELLTLILVIWSNETKAYTQTRS